MKHSSVAQRKRHQHRSTATSICRQWLYIKILLRISSFALAFSWLLSFHYPLHFLSPVRAISWRGTHVWDTNDVFDRSPSQSFNIASKNGTHSKRFRASCCSHSIWTISVVQTLIHSFLLFDSKEKRVDSAKDNPSIILTAKHGTICFIFRTHAVRSKMRHIQIHGQLVCDCREAYHVGNEQFKCCWTVYVARQ